MKTINIELVLFGDSHMIYSVIDNEKMQIWFEIKTYLKSVK